MRTSSIKILKVLVKLHVSLFHEKKASSYLHANKTTSEFNWFYAIIAKLLTYLLFPNFPAKSIHCDLECIIVSFEP